jgi:hypothetical protein
MDPITDLLNRFKNFSINENSQLDAKSLIDQMNNMKLSNDEFILLHKCINIMLKKQHCYHQDFQHQVMHIVQ